MLGNQYRESAATVRGQEGSEVDDEGGEGVTSPTEPRATEAEEETVGSERGGVAE